MTSILDLEAARRLVRTRMPATPAYRWPLLEQATGTELWVKHENHTPTGAFKVRGGIVYVDGLVRDHGPVQGIVSATRGNHGQSLARAATAAGIACTIVVPETNSVEKNEAMRAFGAELVAHGRDFDEARAHAGELALDRGLVPAPSFHPHLVQGVASYALELFEQAGPLDAVYVPIGLGSGICGLITARDHLGLQTEIIGVVAAGAPAYALSFSAGRAIATDEARTFADGMACRMPEPAALETILRGAARVLTLEEDEIAAAVRLYYKATHNVAEGAGAAPLAGLMQERERMAAKRCAVVLCGGNIDASAMATILAGRTPEPF